jgi:predicted CDP-diglyceride synthetase/phosphatidate cytidylyltransferase
MEHIHPSTVAPYRRRRFFVTEINATERETERKTPRLEPWFKVVLSAFAPMVAAFVLPRAAMIPMFVITGVLMLAGFVMLIMHERKKS